MDVSSQSPPVTRRQFLEKSVKGTTALALSGLVAFSLPKGAAADRSPSFLEIPSPQFTAWTPEGMLLVTFIAEDGSYGILRTDGDAKSSSSLPAIGSAAGQFNWPQGIAVDRAIAYIVDSNNGRIQRLDLKSQRFLEPFGGLGRRSGYFFRPRGICVFENEIFIADTRNHRVQVFTLDGVVKRIFGEIGDGDAQFRLPTSCAVSPRGEVFVVDSKHAVIKVFDLQGRLSRKFGGLSSSRKEPGLLSLPTGISLDGKGDVVYVADTGNSRIQTFNARGEFIRILETPGTSLKAPLGLALSGSGRMAIADPDADRVWMTTV